MAVCLLISAAMSQVIIASPNHAALANAVTRISPFPLKKQNYKIKDRKMTVTVHKRLRIVYLKQITYYYSGGRNDV